MASKIQGRTFYVAIAPYKGGANEETFNELSVMVSYDDRKKRFYVCLHAGWSTGWGGHGCIFLGPDDPLTAPKYVDVKDSPKNSRKTIEEMSAALELAKDAIKWLFDRRDWTRLYAGVRNIALNGYTEQYRKQMEGLMQAEQEARREQPAVKQVDVMAMFTALKTKGEARLSDFATPVETTNNSTNETNKEDKDMRLNLNANKNESVNVQAAAPVMNPVEDAVAVEIHDEPKAVPSVEVAEVEDIIVPKPVAKPKPKPEAVTVPLSEHGTMVVGKPGLTPKKPSPDPEAVGELAGMMTKVNLVVYKTKKGNDAPMIVGFTDEQDPRWKKHFDAKPKWVSAGYRKNDEGAKQYHLMFGSRYMDVAKALCEAYNTTDKAAWAKAEQACADNYSGIVSGFKAEKEARKAERAAAKEAKAAERQAKAEPKPAPKTYTNEDVADMLRKVLAGGDVPEDIKAMMLKKAA